MGSVYTDGRCDACGAPENYETAAALSAAGAAERERCAKLLDVLASEQRALASDRWVAGRHEASDLAAAHATHLEDAAAAIRSIPTEEK